MKKVLSIIMIVTMLLGATLLASCGGQKSEPLKLGLGIVTSVSAKDATADKNGEGQATVTAAAVLVDADGKIVKVAIDCADNKVGYTADGKAVANDSFKTKLELGDDYGMKSPYGSTKEWYEHVEAFCDLVVGKTATEVLALVAEDEKGTEEVLNAGCTIYVSDFAKAIDKAIKNVTESNATAKDSVKLGVSTNQTTTDATVDKEGSNQVETTFFAAAVDADGKIVAASSDCVAVKFTFDTAGVSTFDATKAVQSKLELGDDYGMKSPYGSAKEWYEHAAAFDAACIGKKATEIGSLMNDEYKGNADLQAAGCTITINGFVAAASKIG